MLTSKTPHDTISELRVKRRATKEHTGNGVK